MTPTEGLGEIAVVGMACRFPGAKNLQAFWENLRKGVESIYFFSQEELLELPEQVLKSKNYVKACARLEDVDLFDASFFGLSPKEAEITDPQQRFFLECAWEALEHGGYNPDTHGAALGVFAGTSSSFYINYLLNDSAMAESEADLLQLAIGNDKDHIAPRLSYLLNLQGPSLSIQTACSTSLVAVHMACQSLIHYECDMALGGGCGISVPMEGYLYQEGGILSPDGHCRAFDAKAKGTVPGNGVGVVLLKRLEDALADGDHIYAIIKGSAINNDGAAKVGYTAPSVEGQKRVIQEALTVAGLEPESISYIEAHGTGTTLGDPIEIEALRQAFGNKFPQKQYCAIGSVKTNIGHCDVAAGVAGLIKTILCLKNKTLVPSLNFEQPNPQIDLESSPFFVNTTTVPWKQTPKYAGVSSFGIGGTNAHIILQEAPPKKASEPSRPWQILTLSAKTESALKAIHVNLRDFLKSQPDTNLTDMAFTLNQGRKDFNFRSTIVFCNSDEALEGLHENQNTFHLKQSTINSVVFMFPGQGTDYSHLGRDLYECEPCFREHIDYCCRLLKPSLGLNLAEWLFGEDAANHTEDLKQPSLWQPTLFIIEYALAQLWMSWGIRPEAMIGHSIGEYVAATLAGVFSLENALKLVTLRGHGTQKLAPGAMLAVPLSEEALGDLIQEPISLASINAPNLCVVSGPIPKIDKLEAKLKEEGHQPIRLNTTHAFHSGMMTPLMNPLTNLVSTFTLHPPELPLISNVTGTWMSKEQATDPQYWATHLRNPVRFNDGLEELLKEPRRIFLEVGPGTVLTHLMQRRSQNHSSLASMTSTGESNVKTILTALAGLWREGIVVDWSAFYRNETRARIPLPAYPFERKSYWIQAKAQPRAIAPDPLDIKRDLTGWFYLPIWKQSPFPRLPRLEKQLEPQTCWLVFIDTCGFGELLVQRLQALQQTVIQVCEGDFFEMVDNLHFSIHPADPEGYKSLLETLQSQNRLPTNIIHAWRIDRTITELDLLNANLERGFSSLILLAQTLGALSVGTSIRLGVLTNHLQQVVNEKELSPEKATLLGALQVIPKEYPNIFCQSIDIEISQNPEQLLTSSVDSIIREFALATTDEVISYRAQMRWVLSFENLDWQEDAFAPPLRQNGTYLITNALQEIGLCLTERLSQKVGADLILVDRAFFPEPEEWEAWVREQGEQDFISQKIRRIQALSTRVKIICADISDFTQMQTLRTEISREFGPIEGVFHLDKPAETGLIQGKSPDTLSCNLGAKIKEALVLEKLFSNLNFLILFAQNSAEAGGLGQVEQSATYAFLDQFARALAAKSIPATAIDWGTRQWEDAQEHSLSKNSPLEQQLQQKRELFGMTPEECLDALEWILELALPQVIVSTRDYQAVMAEQNRFTVAYFQEQLLSTDVLGTSHSRPNLSHPYVPPSNEVEQLIAETWQSCLGIQGIGIHDNFFELGGHSLLVIQLLEQLNQTFCVKLTLQNLFESPTIAELASIISREQLDVEDAEVLDQILAEIEGLSPGQVRAALEAQ